MQRLNNMEMREWPNTTACHSIHYRGLWPVDQHSNKLTDFTCYPAVPTCSLTGFFTTCPSCPSRTVVGQLILRLWTSVQGWERFISKNILPIFYLDLSFQLLPFCLIKHKQGKYYMGSVTWSQKRPWNALENTTLYVCPYIGWISVLHEMYFPLKMTNLLKWRVALKTTCHFF